MKTHIKVIIKDIVSIAVIFILFLSFGYASFHIPSGSMEPTLEVGDRVFVSKFAYGYNQYSIPFDPPIGEDRIFYDAPERGDVAVFTLPHDDNKDFIKRVIGLPGDRIEMISGRLYINDEMVKRELIGQLKYTNYRGTPTTVWEYDETLPNGIIHRIYEVNDSGDRDNSPLIVVPEGHFFMMGDNRDHSADSRSDMGPVKKEYLVGRAEFTTFSFYDCDQGKEVTCKMGIPFGRFFRGL